MAYRRDQFVWCADNRKSFPGEWKLAYRRWYEDLVQVLVRIFLSVASDYPLAKDEPQNEESFWSVRPK